MKNKKSLNLEQSIERLEEISKLEGSELGEAWEYLLTINRYNYCLSGEFNRAVIKEIIKQAQDSYENFEIVEEEEIKTPVKYKVLKQKY